MKAVKKDRIATVKATGRRFLVDRLEIPRDGSPTKVFVHAEIHSARETANGGAQIRVSGTRKFLRDAVEIEEKALTYELIKELWTADTKIRAAKQGQVAEIRTTRRGNTRGRGRVAGADELMRRAATAEEAGEIELAEALMNAAEKAEQRERYEAEHGTAGPQHDVLTQGLIRAVESLMKRTREEQRRRDEFEKAEWEAEARANRY